MKLDDSQYIARRLASLKEIRSPFEEEWLAMSDNILGYRGCFGTKGKKRARKVDTTIINNTASISSAVLSSGLMGGVSSPSKPWVNFVVSNADLMENTDVRIWLEKVEKIVSLVMSKSNIYNSIHTLYSELGVFGTGALGIYEDYNKVIKTECYTAGTYYLDINEDGIVDTFYRELVMTANDIINKFGKDALPDGLLNGRDFDKNSTDFNVIHAVEPNRDIKNDSKLAKDKPFSSTYIYYESWYSGGGIMNNPPKGMKVLHKSGYDEFPIMVARWDVIPGDVYGGMYPGLRAIGDTKSLQFTEELKARALEKQVDPPTMSAISTGNIPDDGLEAGQNYEVDNIRESGIESIYKIDFNLGEVNNSILQMQERIKIAFYENLFLQMLSSDRREMTASEVNARENESLIALGPVLTRLHNECLDPLTDRVFNIIARTGILPDAPPELEGYELNVEYISTLAKAQKADVSNTIERSAAFIAGLSEVFPNARHKMNEFSLINEFSSAIGLPPKSINSDKVASQLVAQEQQQMQEQQQQQMMLEAAKVAPGLAKAGEETETQGQQ